MALLTASEVTQYSNITASNATIVSSGLIPIIQERVCMICNNYFLTDLELADVMDFNATDRTVIATNSFVDKNFLAGDDCMIYNSYRNDGVYTIHSVSTVTLTLATGSTIVDELSGQTILISVIKWPLPIKKVAAEMIAFDYDVRPKISGNIRSRSLGPWSESYTTGDEDQYGYPSKILNALTPYKIARLM